MTKRRKKKVNRLKSKYREEIVTDWDRDIATISRVFCFTPDIVASFSLQQIKKYKDYAYKWDYIQCSQFNGLKPRDYDSIFTSQYISSKNRKNSIRQADAQMNAIKALGEEGIERPTMKQINEKIRRLEELDGNGQRNPLE